MVSAAVLLLGLARIMTPSERFTSTCSVSVLAMGLMLLVAAGKIGTTSSLARSVLPAPQLASAALGRVTRSADGSYSVEAALLHDHGRPLLPAMAEGLRQLRERLRVERAGARPGRISIGFRVSHAHAGAPEDGLVAMLEYDSEALLGLGERASEAEMIGAARAMRLSRSYAAGVELLASECKARSDAVRSTALCRGALMRRAVRAGKWLPGTDSNHRPSD